MPDESVLTDLIPARGGTVGRIVLSRPKAINALSLDMIRALDATLAAWEQDDAIVGVWLGSSSEKGLCAGADVRELRGLALADPEATRQYLVDEYALDRRIAHYPKPYLAWMDGIVMGGGLGVSVHGSLRIATERTQAAMPETLIGLQPDVGVMWQLSRSPGEIGTHLALTGATVTGWDARWIGLADHLVPSTTKDAVLAAFLADPDRPDLPLGPPPPPGVRSLAEERAWVDACYTGDDAAAILRRLLSDDSPAAREAGAAILARSPLAVSVALAAIRRAREMSSVDEVFDQDTRITPRMALGPDFVEGVDARLISKTNRPRWSHRSLADVTPTDVSAVLD